jgi:hypothetical protein
MKYSATSRIKFNTTSLIKFNTTSRIKFNTTSRIKFNTTSRIKFDATSQIKYSFNWLMLSTRLYTLVQNVFSPVSCERRRVIIQLLHTVSCYRFYSTMSTKICYIRSLSLNPPYDDQLPPMYYCNIFYEDLFLFYQYFFCILSRI